MKAEIDKRKEETKHLRMLLNGIKYEIEQYENLYKSKGDLVEYLKDSIKALIDTTFKLIDSDYGV